VGITDGGGSVLIYIQGLSGQGGEGYLGVRE